MATFNDNFESGDLTNWNENYTDGGNLSVTAGAALHGSYGLSGLINDTNQIICMKSGVYSAAKRYRFRFYFDPNSATVTGDFNIANQQDSSYAPIIQINIKKPAGVFKLYCDVRDDGGGYGHYSSEATISDAPHCIEFDWTASSAPGANNGTYSFWVDGTLISTTTGLDTDTLGIDYSELGASGFGSASGTLYWDDFASNNDGSEIGVIGTNYAHSLSLSGVGS